MRVRFQADADLKEQIVVALKRHEPLLNSGPPRRPAWKVLKIGRCCTTAARAGRVLVSHDRRTMPRHFGEFIANDESPGLIIVA